MSENSPVEPAGGSPAAGMQERATTSSSGKQGDGNVVSRAAALLRQHTDSGWKAIEDSVITRALTLFRPSAPVRGRHDLGDFFLAADVVVNELRQRIDAVPRAAAQKIACTTGERDELEQVTVELIAAYGAPLLEVAGTVHTVAMTTLQELLGALAPAAERVRTHVHIGDVSNDPLIVS
ncbi:hypothetical protein OG218_00570 [Kineococcus sp. NBC_00420]|uniref:hypothetical protein n=1 Tax=Kineococcus sp. NBC_00420 TaxID=2903564 RepID=UPI002E202225